jgi:gamma-glutamyl-gamma-aminobutyrate hydrolase PuuD
VQYHPEWHFRTDAPSRALFAAFGAAVRAHASTLRTAA